METNNLEVLALAKCELEWFGELIDGVDENGEYKITTLNPDGKWDWYKFLDVETNTSGLSAPRTFIVREIPEFVPYAVVTPDSKWHELGQDAGLEAFFNRQIRGLEVISEDEIKMCKMTK
ncbi:MAG: hypothetical protein WBA93_20720 [Microcoleaceae cyanobacterium]